MRKPSDKLLLTLSGHIKNYRYVNNLSQEDLANKCGFHRTYVGSIERCERNTTLSTLEVLANTLGVKITDLLKN